MYAVGLKAYKQQRDAQEMNQTTQADSMINSLSWMPPLSSSTFRLQSEPASEHPSRRFRIKSQRRFPVRRAALRAAAAGIGAMLGPPTTI